MLCQSETQNGPVTGNLKGIWSGADKSKNSYAGVSITVKRKLLQIYDILMTEWLKWQSKYLLLIYA